MSSPLTNCPSTDMRGRHASGQSQQHRPRVSLFQPLKSTLKTEGNCIKLTCNSQTAHMLSSQIESHSPVPARYSVAASPPPRRPYTPGESAGTHVSNMLTKVVRTRSIAAATFSMRLKLYLYNHVTRACCFKLRPMTSSPQRTLYNSSPQRTDSMQRRGTLGYGFTKVPADMPRATRIMSHQFRVSPPRKTIYI